MFADPGQGDVMDQILKNDAENLVRQVISTNPGLIGWSKHCRAEMLKDHLIANDLLNVLRSGKIRRRGQIQGETNDFIYRIETAKIAVVFKFVEFVRGNDSDLGIKLITCWRKSPG